MSRLRIRRYRPEDADAVWDLHVVALRDVGAFDEEFAHLDADLRDVRSEYLDAGGEFLVGERDGRIVAMGAFQPHEDREETVVIRRMRVHPSFQRRGYGARILDALEARALGRGFRRAVLETTAGQTAAVAFYEERGYERLRRETVADREVIVYGASLADGT